MTNRGQDAQFKSAQAGSVVALVGERKSWKITTRAGAVDDGAQGDDWETYKPGRKGFDISLDGHLDSTDAAQAEFVEGELIDFECYPEGADGTIRSGQALITSTDIGTDMEGIVSISISAKGVGPLVRT